MNVSKAIRNGAYFDLVWAIPLALPIVSRNYIGTLSWLHSIFALEGVFPFFSSIHLLVLNFVGIQTVLWTWVRLIRPEHEIGRIDMTLRVLRAVVMLYYYIWEGVTSILLFGALTELYWVTTCYRALLVAKQNEKQDISKGTVPDKYEQIGT